MTAFSMSDGQNTIVHRNGCHFLRDQHDNDDRLACQQKNEPDACAFDGQKFTRDESETKPMGNALAAPQEFRIERPTETATHDFALPRGS